MFIKMNKSITVGFLTAKNPLDKKSWSGTHYKMYQSLKNEFDEVIALGPIHKNIFIEIILLIITLFNFLIFFKKYKKSHSIVLSKFYAYKIKTKLKKMRFDVIFAPAGSAEIAYLKTAIPICYLSDTSFGQITNYYSNFSNLSKMSFKESNGIEQKAINNSLTQVYSSNWAAEYVIINYKALKENVFTVKFGANLDFIPAKSDLVKEFNAAINLLFIGVNWKRKGGNIVLETYNILIENGHNVSLTIIGCKPPNLKSNSKIKIIPFIDKNNPKEFNNFLNILFNTHLLFVPTRADCTPIVFCEANAFGIPVITTDTGGVSSIIKNGENGFAFPLDATPDEYANTIQSLLDDPLKLK
ncbi:MAG: glycosyl transferase [Bacteroidetes bacterium HGW-Bacteroidetes-3]|nr:MAG: glycosyl transferase [Bacteroidetes bacterium HGW-Bacteroidetes-3]